MFAGQNDSLFCTLLPFSEKKKSKKKLDFFFQIFSTFFFLKTALMGKIDGYFVPRDSTKMSRPVPWQNFELVLLSLCPGTMKKLLSLCPQKLHCPVPLETLILTKGVDYAHCIITSLVWLKFLAASLIFERIKNSCVTHVITPGARLQVKLHLIHLTYLLGK